MTRRDDTVSIRQMFDHAVEAVEMARGRTRADLDRDRQLNLALVRLVEIIGTRDRLIHGTRSRAKACPGGTFENSPAF